MSGSPERPRGRLIPVVEITVRPRRPAQPGAEKALNLPTGRPPRLVPFVEITTKPQTFKRRLEPNAALGRPHEGSPRKRGRVRGRSASPVIASSVQGEDSPAPEFVQGSSRPLSSNSIPDMDDIDMGVSLRRLRAASLGLPLQSLNRKLGQHSQEEEEEIQESPDLILPEEDDESDSEDVQAFNSDDDEVPVRLLSDFTIYDSNSKEVVHAEALLSVETLSLSASGVVRPWLMTGDDSDEEPVASEDGYETESEVAGHGKRDRVSLTKILELNIHYASKPNDGGRLQDDGKIYIRTKYAWYVLGLPSEAYRPFYTAFWTKHRVTHLLFMALRRHPKLDEGAFCAMLPELDEEDSQTATAQDMLGRDLAEEDYESDETRAYLLGTLLDRAKELGVSRMSFIRRILALEASATYKSLHTKEKKPKILDRDHRTTQPTTYTTERVSLIARNLFEVKMDAAQPGSATRAPTNPVSKSTKVHLVNTDNIKWGKRLQGQEGRYKSVFIEGIEYKINDVVTVLPEAGQHDHAFGRTPNILGNTMWFIQIKSFDQKKMQFHGQWFLHGSRTMLNELSHPLALHPINRCDDQPLNAIYQKCHIRMLGKDELEDLDDVLPDAHDFHYGLFYNHEFGEFVDLPKAFLDSLDGTGDCSSCQFKKLELEKRIPTITEDGIAYGGVLYHINDFVYVLPEDGKLLHIAQILKIKGGPTEGVSVVVRVHMRQSDLEKSLAVEPFASAENRDLFCDERRLILSSSEAEVFVRKADLLAGHCYVQHLTKPEDIEDWIQHDNHFYVKDIAIEGARPTRRLKAGEMKACLSCSAKQTKAIETQQAFRTSSEKLVGLELFSGAGGLGYGMELSGYVDTKYAIEFQPSAALTYQKNHPDTTVWCQDSNTLLRHVVERDSGASLAPLKTIDGTKCPEMPKKGDRIDFIFGGPPCQAFSRMNHSRRADDLRSTMPCNMLSYVEHYQPKYFLLENVGGLMDFKLTDNRFPDNGNGHVIEKGMVKFIAAQYGVPQSRQRLIFLGAKRGLALPDFPVPVYAYPKGAPRISVEVRAKGGALKIPPPSRWQSKFVDGDDCDRFHQCAPLKMRTIYDAISDLSGFDWINPQVHHRLSKAEHRSLNEENQGRTWFGTHIKQVDAVSQKQTPNHPVGYPDGAPYATPPQNRYQMWLRRTKEKDHQSISKKGKERAMEDVVQRGSTEESIVHGHYTNRFGAKQVEPTTMVPLLPGKHHRHIPMDLWPDHAKPGGKQATKHFFGRVGGDGCFKCAMTQMAPNLKQIWPLHPDQRRMYSMRECARAQGFPDHYEFYSVHDKAKHPRKVVADQIKQIGNAVAVPFALALGKEIGAARIADWKREQGQDSREGSVEV
ncbi:hypothetical protein D9611_004789 [Ephemerocybe angulata]|uniref:Cytosine-specific methyltransferase n=1 Tax=Ephemerocybe angulata TaxID=980116 RepID=A0A8H5B530_9AGAR|nr:hypothetical protein D9611_004789 [Tulosesus angulatus]